MVDAVAAEHAAAGDGAEGLENFVQVIDELAHASGNHETGEKSGDELRPMQSPPQPSTQHGLHREA